MRLRAAAVATVLVALASLGGASAATGPKLHGNNFFSNCRFSHFAPDDPIVHPGKPGLSHPHTFFGNTTTNAYSTLISLERGSTTCAIKADRAAYWVPSLFQNGKEIRPDKAQAYYVLRGYGQMHPFPAGLKVVAGNAHAIGPQPLRVTYWDCGASAVRTRISSTVPRCGVFRARLKGFFQPCPSCKARPLGVRTVKTFLELHVDFPDCWDGRRLDSPDHASHMAYSRDYVCPASHPVKVPLIRLNIRYPISDTTGVAVASGTEFSGHADFFNAWDERTLARIVDACFHDRPCDPKRF
jgi:hypothetical protein